MVRERVEHLAGMLAQRLRSGRLARRGLVKLMGDGELEQSLAAQIVLTDARDLLQAAEAGEHVSDERWLGVLGDLETLCELTAHPGANGAETADVPIGAPSQLPSKGADSEGRNGRSDEWPRPP